MKSNLRTLLACTACAVLAAAPLAYSAGLWETWVQIAGPSQCVGTVTGTGNLGGVTGTGQGTTGSICQTTIPAGPPSITGLETVPADLISHTANAQAGGATNGLLEMQQLSTGYTYQAINSTNQASTINLGVTYQIPQTALLVLDPTGAVTAMTLALPVSPLDGDHIRIASTATLTALVITPGVSTVTFKGVKPTTLPTTQAANTTATQAPTELEFLYNAAYTAWMRLQ